MSDFATFTGPGGGDPGASIHATIHALTTPTVGDLLYIGQAFRSRIRERTGRGVDVNGVPFQGYSTKGPYYFYPNRDVGSTRGVSGTRSASQSQVNKARATAAAGRFSKTGKLGQRTPFGIRYESYAAAHAAHGRAGVTLYGLESHPHMLDSMLIKAGGNEVPASGDAPDFGSPFTAFEGNTPATDLHIGFYGSEAARAKGNNEGNGKVPKREFFALNQEDLRLGEAALAERLEARAAGG